MMAPQGDTTPVNEHTPLIHVTTPNNTEHAWDSIHPALSHRFSDPFGRGQDEESVISKEELAMANTALGERLPYDDYNTIGELIDSGHEMSRSNSIGEV
jgi:hypothetical protein